MKKLFLVLLLSFTFSMSSFASAEAKTTVSSYESSEVVATDPVVVNILEHDYYTIFILYYPDLGINIPFIVYHVGGGSSHY